MKSSYKRNIICSIALLITSPFVLAEAAVKINPALGCSFFNAEGAIVFIPGNITIQTNSENNNALASCKGTIPAPLTGKAVIYNSDNNPYGTGIECVNGIFGSTLNWQEVISASGEVMVKCIFKDQK